MYTLVRRFIKTGIGFLGLGVVLGVYMLVAREIMGVWPPPYLVSAHAHAMLAGFVLYLILSVALWLCPRAERDDHALSPAPHRGGVLGADGAWLTGSWQPWLIVGIRLADT